MIGIFTKFQFIVEMHQVSKGSGNSHQRAMQRAATNETPSRLPVSNLAPQPAIKKNPLDWITDNPKTGLLAALLALILAFSPSSSTIGIWCSVFFASACVVLLIREYAAKTKLPRKHFLLSYLLVVPVVLFGIWRTPVAAVVFKDQSQISLFHQYELRLSLTRFINYLDDAGAQSGVNIPRVVPLVAIGQRSESDLISAHPTDNVLVPVGAYEYPSGAETGTDGSCVFRLAPKDVGDDKQAVWLYSACVATAMIMGGMRGNGPEVPRKARLSGIIGTYFFCSYYFSSDSACPWGNSQMLSDSWFKALWDLRSHFGRNFMDRAVLLSVQQIRGDPGADPTETLDSYFGNRLIYGIGVMTDNYSADSTYFYKTMDKYAINIVVSSPRKAQGVTAK
jgi:hypothetical protein